MGLTKRGRKEVLWWARKISVYYLLLFWCRAVTECTIHKRNTPEAIDMCSTYPSSNRPGILSSFPLQFEAVRIKLNGVLESTVKVVHSYIHKAADPTTIALEDDL